MAKSLTGSAILKTTVVRTTTVVSEIALPELGDTSTGAGINTIIPLSANADGSPGAGIDEATPTYDPEVEVSGWS